MVGAPTKNISSKVDPVRMTVGNLGALGDDVPVLGVLEPKPDHAQLIMVNLDSGSKVPGG